MKPSHPLDDHLSCYNYSHSAGRNSLLNIKTLNAGETYFFAPKSNYLIIALEGEFTFSYGPIINYKAKAKDMFIHPAHSNCIVIAESDISVIEVKLDVDMSFCDHYSFEKILLGGGLDNEDLSAENLHSLQTNDRIEAFIDGLLGYMDDGLRCGYLFELKIREVLYLIRFYYPREELNRFFKPILTSDLIFSIQVEHIYNSSNGNISAKEMAEKMHYSDSGFIKKFKKIYNKPLNQWMQMKKAQMVYHDINCSTKTFSELAYEHNFSSSAHFSKFCKKQFNKTPSELRNAI